MESSKVGKEKRSPDCLTIARAYSLPGVKEGYAIHILISSTNELAMLFIFIASHPFKVFSHIYTLSGRIGEVKIY